MLSLQQLLLLVVLGRHSCLSSFFPAEAKWNEHHSLTLRTLSRFHGEHCRAHNSGSGGGGSSINVNRWWLFFVRLSMLYRSRRYSAQSRVDDTTQCVVYVSSHAKREKINVIVHCSDGGKRETSRDYPTCVGAPTLFHSCSRSPSLSATTTCERVHIVSFGG